MPVVETRVPRPETFLRWSGFLKVVALSNIYTARSEYFKGFSMFLYKIQTAHYVMLLGNVFFT